MTTWLKVKSAGKVQIILEMGALWDNKLYTLLINSEEATAPPSRCV